MLQRLILLTITAFQILCFNPNANANTNYEYQPTEINSQQPSDGATSTKQLLYALATASLTVAAIITTTKAETLSTTVFTEIFGLAGAALSVLSSYLSESKIA